MQDHAPRPCSTVVNEPSDHVVLLMEDGGDSEATEDDLSTTQNPGETCGEGVVIINEECSDMILGIRQ